MPRAAQARVAVVVNPVAGRCVDLPSIQAIEQRLRDHAIGFETLCTSSPGHATEIIHGLPDDLRAVIVVGGDGTLREAGIGLIGRPLPMIPFPRGTENLMARELGATQNPEAAVRAILDGVTIDHDVALMNGRPFFIVCGVGFDAEVVERLARSRSGNISRLDYVAPILETFLRHRFPIMKVICDGELVFDGRCLAFVGQNRQYAQRIPVVPHAVPDDGLLDVCVFPCDSPLRLVGHAIRTVLNQHTYDGTAIYRRGRHVRIEAPEDVPIEVDGDCGGHGSAEFNIKPRAIRFLVPRTVL